MVVREWAKMRVPVCVKGPKQFKSPTGTKGGSNQAFFLACSDMGQKGKREGV